MVAAGMNDCKMKAEARLPSQLLNYHRPYLKQRSDAVGSDAAEELCHRHPNPKGFAVKPVQDRVDKVGKVMHA